MKEKEKIQFKLEEIFINVKTKTKKETLNFISLNLVKMKSATNVELLNNAFLNREKKFSTGIGKGVAIAHIRSELVKVPTILFLKHKKNINWKSLDNKPVDLIFVIALPVSQKSNHINKLSALSKLLLNNSFYIDIRKTKTRKNIMEVLNKYLKKIQDNQIKTKIEKKSNKTINIVAVTSCPTGIAHTFLAAEALENYAKENNINIKVEKQAAQNTENKLTFMEIQNAKYVIIATGRPIDGKERFDGKKVVEVPVGAPLKNCANVFEKLKTAKILNLKINTNKESKEVTPMKALLNGLSFMIPFVVVGGLCLAVALGQNGGHPPKPGTFWDVILNIGAAGFSLMVIILGGFIAFAIGGRATLAPTMILTFICNGATVSNKAMLSKMHDKINYESFNPFFFNYSTFSFGVEGSNLGFFGAIAIGLMIGYSMRFWNNNISTKLPKTIKSIEPILLTPLLFSIIGWVIFAFAGYLPLYYLSIGFKMGIDYLIVNNLLWIAGLLLGAMIGFDMGGPVNKVAFMLGVVSISDKQPAIMGAVAAAGAVPPIGSGLGYLMGRHLFKSKSFNNKMDKNSCIPALTMGFCGISEGAIPYAVKHPKSAIFSNVVGSAVASGLAAIAVITCVAAHTGPIVYFVGAIGKDGLTNYGYGLIYIGAMIIGIITTAVLFSTLTWLFEDSKFLKRSKKSVSNKNNKEKMVYKKNKV